MTNTFKNMHTPSTPTSDSALGFDTNILLGWLQQHLPDLVGPLTVSKFKGGQSNPTYLLSTPHQRYVMRSKPGPASKLLPSAHAIEREYQVMQALHGTGVPVPRMLCLCEDESVIGRAFFVMDWIDGTVLWDPALPGLDAAQRRTIFEAMNQTLATLHTVPFAKHGLQNYGKPGNYFERQISRWSKQYTASITQPIPEMDKLIEWLPRNIPSLARDESLVSIVHGDYRLDNLMFNHPHNQVLAVLDWELSTLGHPLADFSYHCMSWHIPPGDFRGLHGLPLEELGIPSEHEYIQMYCERVGIFSPEQLMSEWNFYLAYNLFRIAAILQGIAKRIEAGTASSAQAIRSAAGARPLAKLAWEFANKS
jgi:aminoglycoside phosphotransferase (APT) family kinase protein